MSSFVNTQNTRPNGYDAVIADIAKQNVCPFCPEHLAEFHKLPLERRLFWTVTDNMYPYQPTKHHKLVIHTKHIEHISEITPEAWKELGEIMQGLALGNEVVGGTMLLRFGNTQFTGGTVSHLHANLVQSNPDDPSYDPKIGLVRRIG